MRMSFTIRSQTDRDEVAQFVSTLKEGMRVEVKHGRRSPEQSNLMWAKLNDVANQVIWHGEKLPQTDWKDIFTAALRRARVVPNIDGDGFVQLGLHTSDLTKEEMSNLLDLIDAFGAEHGVKFKENSSDASHQANRDRTDTPGEGRPHLASPGVNNSDQESSLAADWRDVYIQNIAGQRDKAASLLKRHSDAMQMMGGEPNDREIAWMRMVWRLTQRRNEAKLKRGEFDAEIERLKIMPLPAAKDAA